MHHNRWFILAVLFLARTSMGFQFQSVASVSPFLIDELAIDRPLRPSVPAECHGLSASARQAGTVTTGRAPGHGWRHRSLKLSLVTMSALALIMSA